MDDVHERMTEIFRKLTAPRSIVVVGASNDHMKPGGRIIENIKRYEYKGDLWAINPKSLPIMDLPTFKKVDELPKTPELAIIAIPAPYVVSSLDDLEQKGVKSVVILSAGFSEIGEAGRQKENELLKIANRSGMTLIGPNCLGILTPTYAGKFAGIIPKNTKGAVDFISCSGATVDQLMEQGLIRGLSFSNVVTTGNSAQCGVEDIIALMDDSYGPDSSPILLLYMESIKKPDVLLKHARSLRKKGCTIIGVKSGVTQIGSRAAASHTGAIATNDTAVDCLFAKSGIIRVSSKIEMIDITCILTVIKGPLGGKKVCIITDAGGPGVMLSDEISRQEMELPVLGQKTQSRLHSVLPPESSVGNPIDCLPTRNGEQVKAILNILEEEEKENIDVIAIITSNSMLRDNWDTYESIIEWMDRKDSIPLIPVLSPGTTAAVLIDKYKSHDKIYFQDEVPLGKALGKIAKRPHLFEPKELLEDYHREKIGKTLSSQNEAPSPEIVKEILGAAGFNLPLQIEVFEKESLIAGCEKIGYPLVMKVIGPLHKSDVGGVRIGISDYHEADSAWQEMLEIKEAKGVVIQPAVEGHEVILGAVQEGDFGHLIMFGFGGIFTEIMDDIQFALAPLSEEECLSMIRGVKAYPIIKGSRGMKGMAENILVEYLLRLSQLVTDFPEIKEIDLNPLKGFNNDLFVIDSRIILNRNYNPNKG